MSGKCKVHNFTPQDSDKEIVAMFSPKASISTVDNKDNNDESSIYFDLLSSEILPSKDDKTTKVVGKVIGTEIPGIIHILINIGASATIILRDAIRA